MKGSKTLKMKSAILVAEADVTFLCSFLKKHLPAVDISATCADDTHITFANEQELITYENPNFRAIKQIVIFATEKADRYAGDSAKVLLGRSAPFETTPGAYCEITTESLELLKSLEGDITGRFKQMRPWYFRVTALPLAFVVPMCFFGYGTVLSLLSAVRKLSDPTIMTVPETATRFTTSELTALGILIAMGLLALGTLLDKIKTYVFPPVFFKLGRQAEEFGKRQKWSTLIIGTVAVGVLVNLVSSYIWQAFPGGK